MGCIPDTQETFRDQISEYVLEQLGAYDGDVEDETITEVEENCGSIWITMKDGKTYSIQIIECEKE